MKTLPKLQKIHKIVNVLARIAQYACFLYAVCALAAAIAACAAGDGSLAGWIRAHMKCETQRQVLATLFSDAAFAVTNGLLGLYAARYARAELADGTPFTARAADEMRALGILSVVLPIAAVIVSAAIHKTLGAEPLTDIDCGSAPLLGIVLLIGSLLLRCGAEQAAETR